MVRLEVSLNAPVHLPYVLLNHGVDEELFGDGMTCEIPSDVVTKALVVVMVR